MRTLLLRELDGFTRELALFPNDESIWKTLPGVTNSAGNLALHLAGNLQHYIGVVLGGSSYRRNRDLEFSRKAGTRAEVIEELTRASNIVRDVLASMPEARLSAPYPEAVMGLVFSTGEFLMHLCVHAGFHLGQAGYLRRLVTQDGRSSNPIPLTALGKRA
jgi:hypothetical protein